MVVPCSLLSFHRPSTQPKRCGSNSTTATTSNNGNNHGDETVGTDPPKRLKEP